MSRVVVERTPDREAAIQQWMDRERDLVIATFGESVWPQIRDFIESVPWESDIQAAIIDSTIGKSLNGSRLLTPAESARDVAGRRTCSCVTRTERIQAMSDQLGLRYEEMDKQVTHIEAASEAGEHEEVSTETALYRHFDIDGVLLYVGIAGKPAMRAEQHKGRSKWWRFVATTDVEWYVDRPSAESAEREVIAAELPVFNRAHNARNREAAIDYLFNAVSRASVVATDSRAEVTA